MITIKCEYCNEEITGIIKYGKHMHEKHWEECVKQGRKLRALDKYEFNGVADYIIVQKEEYIN